MPNFTDGLPKSNNFSEVTLSTLEATASSVEKFKRLDFYEECNIWKKYVMWVLIFF
jgi:hypothetical protein